MMVNLNQYMFESFFQLLTNDFLEYLILGKHTLSGIQIFMLIHVFLVLLVLVLVPLLGAGHTHPGVHRGSGPLRPVGGAQVLGQ